MIKNWISEQTLRNIAQFDNAMEIHYPESQAYIRDPQKHVERICEECNYLEAVELIDWQKYLVPGCTVLDIGCGGGWLTGYLSKFDSVKTIYALDSSKMYLSGLMPQVVNLMQGRLEKIEPIEGLFTPLLLSDGSLDVVVAASALHHADNLEAVLKEIRRTLKRNGLLFVLNEVPSSRLGHFWLIGKAALKILVRALLGMYKPVSQSVSSSGFLSNPYLGDKDYPEWYWRIALERAGFSVEEHVRTHLQPLRNTNGACLEHFVCRAL